jgi:hypothetical protein
METNNVNYTLLVDQSPVQVYNSITNMRGWWSQQIDGSTLNVGDEFLYHYKDVHICKMRLVEAIPGKKLVWLVLDNHFNFIDDKTEWVNTRLVFDIDTHNGKTRMKFTHVGLTPQYACHDLCNEAWGNYITNSLYKLITTGKGEPNLTDTEGYNTHLADKWKINA